MADPNPTGSERTRNRRCLWCGRPYTTVKVYSIQKYCSKVCAREAQVKQIKERDQRIREEKEAARVERPCQVCGKGFKSPYPAQKYCGIVCQVEGLRRSIEAQKERRKKKGKQS